MGFLGADAEKSEQHDWANQNVHFFSPPLRGPQAFEL